MIKPPLTLFQVEIERLFVDTPESMQSHFSEAPECLDAIDVRPATNELALAVMYSVILFKTYVDKTIIAPPAIAVDDASSIDSAFPQLVMSRALCDTIAYPVS